VINTDWLKSLLKKLFKNCSQDGMLASLCFDFVLRVSQGKLVGIYDREIYRPKIAPESKRSQEKYNELEQGIAPAIPRRECCGCKDLGDVVHDANPKKVDEEIQPVYMVQKSVGVTFPRHILTLAWMDRIDGE
jgi:hypothetical protein